MQRKGAKRGGAHLRGTLERAHEAHGDVGELVRVDGDLADRARLPHELRRERARLGAREQRAVRVRCRAPAARAGARVGHVDGGAEGGLRGAHVRPMRRGAEELEDEHEDTCE